MRAYSLDLRVRIIKAWKQGQTKAAIAQLFMVSLSSVKRYVKKFIHEGHVNPKFQRRRTGKLFLPAYSPDLSPMKKPFPS